MVNPVRPGARRCLMAVLIAASAPRPARSATAHQPAHAVAVATAEMRSRCWQQVSSPNRRLTKDPGRLELLEAGRPVPKTASTTNCCGCARQRAARKHTGTRVRRTQWGRRTPTSHSPSRSTEPSWLTIPAVSNCDRDRGRISRDSPPDGSIVCARPPVAPVRSRCDRLGLHGGRIGQAPKQARSGASAGRCRDRP